ncbi:P27 family phage terminase small subunit [Sphingomonas endophytica]|nr:P27 family phage terminase small subunit [Sphingomonas endophytica]
MTAAERARVPPAIGAGEAMVPPIHLSDLGRLMFNQIADLLAVQGRAEAQFVQIVALLAMRLEQIQRFQAVLEMTGDTCTSTTVRKVDGQQVVTEMIRARPEVAMLSDAMRQAQSLLGELMLSPSAAMKLASGKKDAPGDFDDF